MSKEQKPFEELVGEICKIVPSHVSLGTTRNTIEGMVEEGRWLSTFGKNVVIKAAISPQGIKALRTLEQSGIRANATLTFSASQTLLAAKAGLSFVSPFVGRLDDIGHEGMETVRQILEILRQYSYPTQVIVASVRQPLHVIDAARMGAPIVTMPFRVLQQMFTHPLTDLGLRRFLEDWQSVSRRTSPVDAQKLSGSLHET